jgi:hypothetical protein
MKRSGFALSFLLMALAGLARPQANAPQPQPASTTPKTPLAGPEAHGPQPSFANTQSAGATSNNSVTGTENSGPASSNELRVEPLVPLTPSNSTPVQPPQPKTEILDNSATGSGLSTDGHDPILDPPPLPTGTTSLVGGTVRSVDHVRNQLTIAVFGGNRWKIAFDERTHIFLKGAETTQMAIKKGERVYVDTMLDRQKHEVFARNISVGVAAPAADADGQVMDLDEPHGTVTLRDQTSSAAIHVSVDRNTRIVYGSNPAFLHDLKPGSLVRVRFSPEQSTRGLAREITVLAAPGAAFTYVGKITYLDMHRGVLALQDTLDQKNYEIRFDPTRTQSRNDLAVGSEVRVVAIFEGNRYTAQSITLTRSAEATEKDK